VRITYIISGGGKRDTSAFKMAAPDPETMQSESTKQKKASLASFTEKGAKDRKKTKG